MESIATLNMAINAGDADDAAISLERLTRAANDVDVAFAKTGSAVAGSLGRQSKAVADAAAIERTLLERNSAFRAAQIIRQVSDADKAAAATARAETEAASIERALIDRNAKFRAEAIIKEVRETERSAAARVQAAQEAADLERTLMERNMALRASMIVKEVQQEREAAAERVRLAQQAAAIEQSLQERNASFRAASIIREAQDRDKAAAAAERAAKVTAGYAGRVDDLRASLDPFAAVQVTLAQRTKLLDDAMAHGAITADQHAAMLSKVTRAALDGVKGIDTYSVGLKNGSHHLTNFSFQFNDIVTGLMSGQKPFQVFAQQSGQIIQIFQQAAVEAGSFKGAIKGLWAEMAPFVAAAAPFIGLAAAVTLAAKAGADYHKAWSELERATLGVGAAAGQTAEQVDAQARAAAQAAEISTGAARKIATEYAATGEIAGSVLGDLTALTKDFAKVTSQDVKDATTELAKAFSEPEKGAAALNERLRFLMADEQRQIELMARSGQEAEAQALLVEKLNASMASAKEQTTGWQHALEGLGKTAADVFDAVGKAVDRMVTGGSSAEKVSTLRFQLAAARGAVFQDPKYIASLEKQLDDQFKLHVAEFDRQRQAGLSTQSDRRMGLLDRYDPDTVKRQNLTADRAALLAGGINTARDRTALANLDKQIRELGKDKAADRAANRAIRVEGRGDNAIEQAKAAELAAQLATTRDVEAIAGIKRAQIAQELKGQEVRLLGQVKAKEISSADAEAALAHYRGAAAAKQAALTLETANQIANRDLSVRQEVLGYTQRTASQQAANASSLEEAFSIQRKALEERQALDRDSLAEELNQRVLTGGITAAQAERLRSAQSAAQASDSAGLAEEERLKLLRRDLEIRTSGLQGVIDVAQSEIDLARSAGARQEIEARILAARHEVEVASLKEAMQATKDVSERERLARRLADVDRVYANQVKAANTAERAFYDIESALSSAANSIDNHDWAGAAAALFDAFDTFRRKMDKAGNDLNSKIGAIAGLASGVGGMVGGKGGSALSGAGSGAMAGLGLTSSLATIGLAIPGPGWALAAAGGILGGLGGLFGGGGAKKRAREEAAARAAQEEAQRQEQIATTRRSLEISMLEAQGKTLEAVAARREDELAALLKLDPSLVDLQKQLYAATDAAEATARAAEEQAAAWTLAVEQQRTQVGLMRQLQAMDDAVLGTNVALLATREEELAKLDPLSQSLQKLIWAREDEGKLIEANALKEEEARKVAADRQTAMLAQVQAAEDARTQSLQNMMSALGNAYEKTEALTKSLREFADSLAFGDMSGQGLEASYAMSKQALLNAKGDEIPAAAQAFLKLAEQRAGTSLDYSRDVALARSMAYGGAEAAATNLVGLADMAKALAAQREEAEILAKFGYVPSYLKAPIPGFANGGSFTIGGNPGVDQNVMSINGQPVARVAMGETVSVTPPGRASNDNSEVAALRQQVAQMTALLGQLVTSNDKMERTLTNVTEGGRAMQTEAAS